jgi:hypothetical protein
MACAFSGTTFTLTSTAGGGGSPPFADSTALLKNNADNTKQLQVNLAGISTGTTRTWTVQNTNLTPAGIDVAQSWTGGARQTFQASASTAGAALAPAAVPTSPAAGDLSMDNAASGCDVLKWASSGSSFVPAGIVLRSKVSASSTSSSSEVSLDTYNIPANCLASGDLVRINALFTHNGGTTTGWKPGIKFGSTYVVSTSGALGATDTYNWAEAYVMVTGASSQVSFGREQRFSNGGFANSVNATPAASTSATITVDFRALMSGATSETVRLEWFTIELLKSANAQ